MIKRFTYFTYISLLAAVFAFSTNSSVQAQSDSVSITGVVVESGTGNPLKQVSVSLASTGESTESDENGSFTIKVADLSTELIFNLPGYTKLSVFVSPDMKLKVALVQKIYHSSDNVIITPIKTGVIKDISNAATALTADHLKMTTSSSFDQALQGKVAGLSVIDQSGLPGHKTFMNIRGASSLYANTEPLLFIDGMIHDYAFASNGIIDGFTQNALDILDIDDIMDVAVVKDGLSYLGSAGSNGVINVNTEQESETSTLIQFRAYGGISVAPNQLDVLNANQFKSYFGQTLQDQGFNSSQINTMYPWLNGNSDASDYYKYNNNTNWQESVFKPAALQKYHFFLKGGDDIATYNISTGYLSQDGIIDDSKYTRFNLRINGKINITDKFSVTPNVKLALANTNVPNQGYRHWVNPISSALLKPSIMGPYARDKATGVELPYFDDEGDVFRASNPAAIVKNASGSNVNYVFLSSLKAKYKFNENFELATLVGIDFNNAHENIFIPNLGIVQVDSAANRASYFANEFRSLQNHTTLSYTNKNSNGHDIAVLGGFRYLRNDHRFNIASDLNTPSDDFTSLGQGSRYSFLRTGITDDRSLIWVSYFANAAYNFRNKYFLEANFSYDGNSAINKNNRFNLYPSVLAAWRPVNNLKMRASWSSTGNMFSSVYDNSNLYYTSRRLNESGVVGREAISNDELEIERMATINAGVDVSLLNKAVNIHIDAYQTNTDNLLIYQSLKPSFGFTEFVNNGGQMQTRGIELAADGRFHFGSVVWTVGATISTQKSTIESLDFINDGISNIITTIEGGEMVTTVGEAPNSFYGYKTNGIYASDSDVPVLDGKKLVGPNGNEMQAGDVQYVDVDNNNIINSKDKDIIGDPNSNIFGGLYSAVSFNNIEISFLLNYSLGNDIFNYQRYQMESMSSHHNQSTTVLNRWTSSNVNADMPRASFGDPSGNTAFSDRWIEDGSFLRLKNIRISYELPSLIGLRGITVYAAATNLLTFTNYSGYDPEFQYSSNEFLKGVDYGQTPQSRSFIIGLKLDL